MQLLMFTLEIRFFDDFLIYHMSVVEVNQALRNKKSEDKQLNKFMRNSCLTGFEPAQGFPLPSD